MLVLVVLFHWYRLAIDRLCKAFERQRNAECLARNVDTEIGDLLACLHRSDESGLYRSLGVAASLVARLVGKLDGLLVVDLNERSERQRGTKGSIASSCGFS